MQELVNLMKEAGCCRPHKKAGACRPDYMGRNFVGLRTGTEPQERTGASAWKPQNKIFPPQDGSRELIDLRIESGNCKHKESSRKL